MMARREEPRVLSQVSHAHVLTRRKYGLHSQNLSLESVRSFVVCDSHSKNDPLAEHLKDHYCVLPSTCVAWNW